MLHHTGSLQVPCTPSGAVFFFPLLNIIVTLRRGGGGGGVWGVMFTGKICVCADHSSFLHGEVVQANLRFQSASTVTGQLNSVSEV